MNERIKDLYIQALCEYEDANGVFIPPDFVEKFAELIVRECSAICIEVSNINRIGDTVYEGDVCSAKIKENFGVETEIEVEYCPKCNDEWSGTSCGIPNCGWIVGEEV